MNLSIIYKNLVAIGVFALLALGILTWQAQNTQASVPVGGEYTATSTLRTGTSTLSSSYGTIGSIIVASTSAVSASGPYIAFYDTATTTVATTSLVAKFSFGTNGGGTPPAGTYTFDVAFGQGIQMWVNPAYNGAYTITYR